MSEVRGTPKQGSDEYTVVGVINDGVKLNQAVSDIRELGISGEDLTMVLKRTDPDEPEPFPEGTRYVVVPDVGRGLEIPIGFAVVFVITALLFAFTTPGVGVMAFLFFIAIAVVLAAGVFAPVGVDPILQDMQVPAEDSELWNEAFEKGSVLVFANTTDRSILRPIWEALRRQEADFYVIERRLEPQPVSGAILRWAGEEESQEERVAGAQEA